MREGSLEAPTRHRIAWEDPDFTDRKKTEAEMHRIFDICHTCRRCFNLCDAFPRLFDLIDNSESGELDTVAPADYQKVADACTLCDMCFMTKCPYVPPHEFNVDFPHLMLRYRAVEQREGRIPLRQRELIKTDRNGRLAEHGRAARQLGQRPQEHADPSAAGKRHRHRPQRGVAEISRADLRHAREASAPPVDRTAPASGRKAVLYATCFVNYNNPSIGEATRAVLARNGVETAVVYPRCCGMPQLEQGDLAAVAASAKQVAASLGPWIDKGYDIVALVPSCALMLKFEWPLIVPQDAAVAKLAKATFDISEYIVDIARKEGLAPGLSPLDGGVTVQLACHARAQKWAKRRRKCCACCPTPMSR